MAQTLTARSKLRFPTLVGPFCMWHDDCTAMDCEFFRTTPNYYEALAAAAASIKNKENNDAGS